MSVEVRGDDLPSLRPIRDASGAGIIEVEGAHLERIGAVTTIVPAPGASSLRYVVVDQAPFTGGALRVLSNLVWLAAPVGPARAIDHTLIFDTEGDVLAPFTPLDATRHRYRLPPRAFDYLGFATVGAGDRFAVPVPGGCIEAMAPRGALDRDLVERWLARGSHTVAQLMGSLPAPRVVVHLLPGGESSEPVFFGMVGRGGDPNIAFVVASHPSEELVTNWTLVHELSHVVTPYVPDEDAWWGEGLATYYQEVLRAREGSITTEEAFASLAAGMRRGARGASTSVRAAADDMHASRDYLHVYWGGAAIALWLDVTLRARGSSLDEALGRVYAAREGRMGARAMLEAMLGDSPEARRELAAVERALDTPFPDVTSSFEVLGVDPTTGAITGPSALRDAIVAPRSSWAPEGSCEGP